MLNRPLVVPLALVYLALEGWMILLALLDRSVPVEFVTAMRVIAWAGAIDGLYWLATSPWGAGPPPPEPPRETMLSKLLNPLAIRADAIARCDLATWSSLLLRLLMVCGAALVASRFLLMGVVMVVVLLMIFGLLENRSIAIAAFWLLFFTAMTHFHFVPVASLIVLTVPVFLLARKPSALDLSHAVTALACAAMGLIWEYATFENPPGLAAFLAHILQTGTNIQAQIPALFLGSALCTTMSAVEPR